MSEGIYLFTELGILIGIATVVSFIMRMLKQPLLVGYIATGLLVGPLALNLVESRDVLNLFGEIGIAFLLFTVGLNLNLRTIKEFGTIALMTGIGQVVLTTLAGYGVAILLGFPPLSAFYLGIALAFSSTIIIMKLLHERNDLDSLYGHIAIGFLLVQDFIAILLLFLLPLLSQGIDTSSWAAIGGMFFRGTLLIGGVVLLGIYLLPRLNRFISRSQELMLLFAVAWGLGFAALFREAGFSLESGALIAGITLASLPSRREIISRLSPLRDFFIVIFFIFLGSQMRFEHIGSFILPATILSVLVVIGNPLILMSIMGFFGYKKKTSFQTGLTVGQVSEFSFILVALGVNLGHVRPEILSLTTLVGLTTIFISTYLILKSEKVYAPLSPYLGIFERKHLKEKQTEQKKYEAILFGANRIGYSFARAFREEKISFLVIDFNPDIVEALTRSKIDVIYGDADDAELLGSLDLGATRIVASTIPDQNTNTLIAQKLKSKNPSAVFLTVANTIEEALELYTMGADYVLLPHFLGDTYATSLVSGLLEGPQTRTAIKKEHILELNERRDMGHEHLY